MTVMATDDDSLPAEVVPQAAVGFKVGNRIYNGKAVATCDVCQSPFRMEIEAALLGGRSYTGILADLPTHQPNGDEWDHPSVRSIATHAKSGHSGASAAVQRAVIERRQEDLGVDIEAAVGAEADKVLVAQLIVQRGFERLQSGDLEPDIPDVLRAAALLHQFEQATGGGIDEQVWRDVMLVHLTLAQQFIPLHLREEYGKAIEQHPILKALYAESARRQAVVIQETPLEIAE
jgi:hypothetical protein